MSDEPEIEAIADQAEASPFVKTMLQLAIEMDAADAANDAQVVAEVLARRADRMTRVFDGARPRLRGA